MKRKEGPTKTQRREFDKLDKWLSILNDRDKNLFFGTSGHTVYHVWKTLDLFKKCGLSVEIALNPGDRPWSDSKVFGVLRNLADEKKPS